MPGEVFPVVDEPVPLPGVVPRFIPLVPELVGLVVPELVGLPLELPVPPYVVVPEVASFLGFPSSTSRFFFPMAKAGVPASATHNPSPIQVRISILLTAARSVGAGDWL